MDPEIVFLNHGSFGACPREVFRVYQQLQREMEKNPVEFLGRRSADLLKESRTCLARRLGASPEHLIFLTNATTAVNSVARSLSLAEGDEILATDQEYGACDNAWEFVCRRAGARYVRAEIPLPFHRQEFSDRIWRAVTPRTRLIFLSHISSTTALIFPLEEICRRARSSGILTFIDGAHAPGQIPVSLDALGADFYAGNCHKWLCAPKGAAFLHARPEHHSMLDALVISWGYSSGSGGHTGFDAYTGTSLFEQRMQWQGTRDLSAFLAVPAAIEFQKKHDWGRVQNECHEMCRWAAGEISARTRLGAISLEEDYAQMTAIPVPPMDAERLKQSLFDTFRIEVPVTCHRDRIFVRVSVQAYNTRQDLCTLIRALELVYGL